ncbi:general odorant-binding protein 71-like isoform X2 [Phymastichus coffea]|uniref:general odorant-binding protein 71-like isoform X2 n=1 Tax=Phymastichus coffea TaxID=108790 RepID=UPI00273B3391|nr:general odorant-binding protein 71-like isoform X2 [Phymastichus coffea]
MRYFTAIVAFCHVVVFISSIQPTTSLKCRTGNQQSDDQFQKIMQVCRRRLLGYDRDGGREFNGRDTDSQESSDSDSDEDVFDNKFLNLGGNRYNNRAQTNSNNNGNGRYDYAASSSMNRNTSRRNWNDRSDSERPNYDTSQSSNNNRRNLRNNGYGYNNNNGGASGYGDNANSNSNSNRYNNGYGSTNRNNNNNDMYDNDGEREQACVTQCFFNELNLVDQRGYPERSSVTSIMTKNIMDPELRDFVEESVIECFHYLANNGRQEKCQFSQNLLSCLAEKGSERCEDWDDN